MGVIAEQTQYTLDHGRIVPVDDSDHEHREVHAAKYTGNETARSEDKQHNDRNIHTLYTVNSPQLLHLDLNGRPLWFNGWILDDKYEEHQHVNVSKMEVYLSEQKDTNEAPEWQIGGHNMATLKSTTAFKFTQKEHNVWNMIVEIAKDNGAIGQNQ